MVKMVQFVERPKWFRSFLYQASTHPLIRPSMWQLGIATFRRRIGMIQMPFSHVFTGSSDDFSLKAGEFHEISIEVWECSKLRSTKNDQKPLTSLVFLLDHNH